MCINVNDVNLPNTTPDTNTMVGNPAQHTRKSSTKHKILDIKRETVVIRTDKIGGWCELYGFLLQCCNGHYKISYCI